MSYSRVVENSVARGMSRALRPSNTVATQRLCRERSTNREGSQPDADPETADAPYEFAHRLPQMMGALAGVAATLEAMLPELRAMGDRIAEDMVRDAYDH